MYVTYRTLENGQQVYTRPPQTPTPTIFDPGYLPPASHIAGLGSGYSFKSHFYKDTIFYADDRRIAGLEDDAGSHAPRIDKGVWDDSTSNLDYSSSYSSVQAQSSSESTPSSDASDTLTSSSSINFIMDNPSIATNLGGNSVTAGSDNDIVNVNAGQHRPFHNLPYDDNTRLIMRQGYAL